jgi:NAD(P)H-flavin reductase
MTEYPKPAKYIAEIIQKEYLTEKTIKINLQIENSENFFFIPGQFINIQVSPTAYRCYSIASDFRSPKTLTLLISAGHEGIGADFFKNAIIGQKVNFIGPSGRFIATKMPQDELLMAGTGSGVAPLIAILYQLEGINPDQKITLYFGLRSENDIFTTDILDNFKKTLPNFEYHICLSKPSPSWNGMRGHITEFFGIKNPNNMNAFICGNNFMVEEASDFLVTQGVAQENILHEKF